MLNVERSKIPPRGKMKSRPAGNVNEIAYKDPSEFLRGFAIIIRKNNCGNVNEKTMFLTIGKYFGFEKEFCEKSSLIGIYFLYQTADHGAILVFGYGLGTGNLISIEKDVADGHDDLDSSDSVLIINEDGSWKFTSSHAAIETLKQNFDWVKNSIDELHPMFDPDNNALMFHPDGEALFIQKNVIKSIEMKTRVNLDDFTGELKLIHHYLDNDNYDFLRIKNSNIALARKSNGETRIFEEGSYPDKG